jgi:hypothetical protein
MENGSQVKLTAAEYAQLWAQYLNDSGSICMLSFLLAKSEDAALKPVIEYALKLSQSHIQKLTAFFKEEKYKIPYGFKVDEDVKISAPKLYSDSFVLNYIYQMAKVGLTTYSASVASSVRADITAYYIECLTETMQLYKISKDLMLLKGLLTKPPSIPNKDEIEFVETQGFILDVFGEKRPLIVAEIGNLYANIERNTIGVATLAGFSQVAQDKKVKHFFVKGIEIAKKHAKLFGAKLEESNLPIPMTLAAEVSESTEYTFSDKLMMFFTSGLIGLSVGYYGTAVAQSPRMDLSVMYNRLSLEIQLYSEDGSNIMINNRWLEEPPMAPDRKGLTNKNNR